METFIEPQIIFPAQFSVAGTVKHIIHVALHRWSR